MSTQKKNDGGQAFPRPGSHWMSSDGPMFNDSNKGMSLRDWFAAQAPIQIPQDVNLKDADHYAMLFGIERPPLAPISEADHHRAWLAFWQRCEAKLRYGHADAMIAERSK